MWWWHGYLREDAVIFFNLYINSFCRNFFWVSKCRETTKLFFSLIKTHCILCSIFNCVIIYLYLGCDRHDWCISPLYLKVIRELCVDVLWPVVVLLFLLPRTAWVVLSSHMILHMKVGWAIFVMWSHMTYFLSSSILWCLFVWVACLSETAGVASVLYFLVISTCSFFSLNIVVLC